MEYQQDFTNVGTAGMESGQQPLLKKRDVYDHDKYDLNLLSEVKDMEIPKSDWKFKMETLTMTWILFNAISTIMIILTNFKKQVTFQKRIEFGESKFEVLMGIVIYFPLTFFILLLLLVNNYYSEITFYKYLRFGALIDFPPTGDFGQLFRRPRPLLFVFVILLYTGLTIYSMIEFEASFGTVIIFFNNMFVGVGLFWYKQQSIEWKFISVSDFIQSFPDRSNSHGNIDEMSLHHAAQLMEKFTLTESSAPSWSSYMREKHWENENYTGQRMVLHHLLVLGSVVALAGLAFAYFFVLGRLDLQSRWRSELNPCINTCLESAGHMNVTAFTYDNTYCGWCACRCMDNLGMKDDDTLDGCPDYWNENLAHCPNGGNACPKTCFFKKLGG